MEEYIYIWFWHFLYKMRAKIRKKSNFGKPHGLSQKTNINNFLTFWSYEEQERNVKKKLILDFEVWTCRHCTHSYTHNKYYLVLNTSIFFILDPLWDAIIYRRRRSFSNFEILWEQRIHFFTNYLSYVELPIKAKNIVENVINIMEDIFWIDALPLKHR